MKVIDYNIYQNNLNTVLYGTYDYGYLVSLCLRKYNINHYFCPVDNGIILPDMEPMTLDEMIEKFKYDNISVILAVSGEEYSKYLDFLEKTGIETVYTFWSLLDSVNCLDLDLSNDLKKIYMERRAQYLQQEQAIFPDELYILSLDAVVTERCSLKCNACSNLMQYYQSPKNIDINDLMKSIDLLLSKVRRIWDLRILGGEPFMNAKFVEIIDKYLPEKKILDISIFTNATIFPNDSLLKHLKHEKIYMRFSDYGELSKNLNRWVAWCEVNKVRFSVNKSNIWHDCGRLERHNYSRYDLLALYNDCQCKNLPTIINGRLFNCPYAAHAANLGAMTVDESMQDGLIIDEKMTSEKLEEFLYKRQYLSACRYCRGRNFQRSIDNNPAEQVNSPLPYKKLNNIEILNNKTEVTNLTENQMISIVIPIYNVNKYLERCLKSVINQTYKNLQIILIDDGSTDNSIIICEEYANLDERIHIIKSKHEGVTHARNMGIEVAKGEFIAFIDADDWIDNNYIETLHNLIADSDLVIGGYIAEGDIINAPPLPPLFKKYRKNKISYNYVGINCGLYKDEEMKILWKYMFFHNVERKKIPVDMWGKLFRTKLVKKIYHLVDLKIWSGETRVFVYIYLLKCISVKIAGILGYHYCIRDNEGENKRYNLIELPEQHLRAYTCLLHAFKGHCYEKELVHRLTAEYCDLLKEYAIYISVNKNLSIEFPLGYYPYYGRLIGKKIILYGAGRIGKLFRYHILNDKECDLALWVDKNAAQYRNEQLDVSDVKSILKVKEYDFIIVAIGSEMIYKEIKNDLLKMGIEEKKILWNKIKITT